MKSLNKPLFHYSITFLLFIAFAGCNKTESSYGKVISPVIINGIIRNYSSDTCSDQIVASFYKLGSYNLISYQTEIKDDGSFNFTFEQDHPQTIWLYYNVRFDVLVNPGDSLFIEIDPSKKSYIDFLEGLKFKGHASRPNKELCQYLISLNQKHPNYRLSIPENSSPNIYKTQWDSLRLELLGHRKSFIKKVRPTSDVETWTLFNVEMTYLNSLLFYTFTRQKFDTEKGRVIWDLPSDYYDFIKKMPEIDIHALIYPGTVGIINPFLRLYLFPKLYNENIENNGHLNSDSVMIAEIINTYKGKLFCQLLLSKFFSEKIDAYNISSYESYSDTIDKYIVEPYLIESLSEHYRTLLTKFENPTLISQTIEESPDDDSSVNILKKIINDNIGKVIYIDCFGTWCGPCMEELPRSVDLMKRYSDQEISFVFLCFTSKKKEYDALISNLALGGQHFFLNNQQSQSLSSLLKISGFPHYIIIDKNGNIVQAGSHLRPSYQSTQQLINTILAD